MTRERDNGASRITESDLTVGTPLTILVRQRTGTPEQYQGALQ